jgi:deoxycytidylate deaminase
MVVHAELNALLLSDHSRRKNGTIYVYPLMPCAGCAAAIIQSGVARVVTVPATLDQQKRWATDFDLTRLMFAEAGVVMTFGELP